MRKRLMAFLLLGTAMIAPAVPDQEPKCATHLPRQLRAIAAQLGCGPVPGFYDRPGMIEPDYLYGYPPGDKNNNAVFWCYRAQAEEPYLLVFVVGLSYSQGRVTDRIPWKWYPGGLRRYESEHVPLSVFAYMDSPKERGPENKLTKYAPLEDYYQGPSTLFYKDWDRWMIGGGDE